MSRVVVALLLLVVLPPVAHAEKRVALVIGNSAYKHAGELSNPRNDATDMAAALRKLTFQVIEGYDLDKASLDRKIRDFASALQGADVGLFFYAGHGLQVAGQNYIVPVDAELLSAASLDFEMVRLDLVHRTMEREAATNVLFLDACRNNPLARNLARALGTRSAEIGRGLAAVESGSGTLISFSTQPGNVASDGAGRNSPFTGPLVEHLTNSTDDLSAVLIAVRNDVMNATQKKQVPWEHSALTRRIYFNSAVQSGASPHVASARLSEAAEAWDRTKDTMSIPALEAFLARFRETYYADLARLRVEELKKQSEPAVSSAAKAAPPAMAVLATRPAGRCDEVETTVGDERRCLTPKDTFRDCPDCPEMVVIPNLTEFTMGSPLSETDRKDNEGPQRRVTIAKPFAAGKFEVTFAEWDACRAAGGCQHKPDDQAWGRGKRPVINVSWDDVKDFVAWLSKHTTKTYRLLTEAEWEYAARAGTTTPFSTGGMITPEQANFNGNATYGGSTKGVYRQKTVEVGAFKPNAFGLHDMHGNVWEWVEDCYHETYTSTDTDAAPVVSACDRRSIRGGSWKSDAEGLRTASRSGVASMTRINFIGFRVARGL